MCGIAGIAMAGRIPANTGLLRELTDSLYHRGPDSGGTWVKGNVGLGHRRLKIIDLSDLALQPMQTEDGGICLTFNGEIYNFQELRRQLQKKGHSFRSTSDTEVLLRMYVEYGIEMVHQLRGMFAFGLWDESARTLYLCRDRIGIKPLLYFPAPSGLYFASELHALKLVPSISSTLDMTAIADFLTFGYVPGRKTLYSSIFRLPPGHILEYRPDTGAPPRLRKYWSLSDSVTSTERVAYEDRVAEIRAKVSECVELRMVSDAPIGSFLSGGVDSSFVSGCMASLSPDPIETFCIGFEDSNVDERHFARIVAEKYGTKHSERVVNPNDLSSLEAMPALLADPTADNSIVPTYFVSQLARSSVTVVLSGDGGDEGFGGYNRYSRMRDGTPFDLLPYGLRKPLFATLSALWPSHLRGKGWLQRTANAFLERYLNMIAIFPAGEWRQMLTPDLRAQLEGYDPYEEYRKIYNALPGQPVERLLRLDVETYLPSDILSKVDLASMSVSLETRVPLLDHELLELSFKIPIDVKMKEGRRKALLKDAARKFVPSELLGPRKQGFVMPLGEWFRGPLASTLQKQKSDPVFEQSGIDKLVELHRRGHRDFGRRLWAILMLRRSLAQIL